MAKQHFHLLGPEPECRLSLRIWTVATIWLVYNIPNAYEVSSSSLP